MPDIDFFIAWQRWLDGPLGSIAIHGLPIWAWARIGKIMQLVAGVLIVIEIIGVARVNKWGTLLRNVHGTLREPSINLWPPFIFGVVGFLILAGYVKAMVHWQILGFPNWPDWVLMLELWTRRVLAIPLLLLVGVPIVLVAIGTLLSPFVAFSVWVLDNPKWEWRAKVFAVLLFSTGFFLDLLGS
ncbi:MAG TPA: hypothetical protein VNU71_03585 [Burkholderiaceae bacterium]|nr:hypothetical protein [Burkholderiaceae bacterium]